VLVVGVDAPDGGNAAKHDVQLTHAYRDAMPAALLQHVHYRVVDRLEPIVQAHTIEGLLMGSTA